MKDYLKELRYCAFCPKLCHFTCPVSSVESRESVTAYGKMSLAYLLQNNAISLDSESAEILYRCLGCLMCRNYCLHKTEVPRVLAAARQKAVEAGVEPEATRRLRNFIRDYGNPYNPNLVEKLFAALPSFYFQSEAQAVYFPGCRAVHSEFDNITQLIDIFNKLNVDYISVFGEREICCGLPLYFAGYHNDFIEVSQRLFDILRRYKLIVCSCPACVYTLKGLYREMGLPVRFEVLHVLEFLNPLLQKSKGRSVDMGRVAYHDPCFLGRYLGVYDTPREILNSCLAEPLKRLPWERQDSYCCGAGGNLYTNFPLTSSRIAQTRIEEAVVVGVDTIATACPGCEEQLRREAGDIKIVDVIEVIYQSLLS